MCNQDIVNFIDNIARGEHASLSSFLENNYPNNIFHAKLNMLSRIYEYEFNPFISSQLETISNTNFYTLKGSLEKEFIAFYEKELLNMEHLSNIPYNADEFIAWFKRLIRNHSSYTHNFYTNYLSESASFEDMRFYLAQESTLDPRFDDLIALMQIGLPVKMKMELANNYWDEMGNGRLEEVHSTMFAKVFDYFDITPKYISDNILPSAQISGNLSSILTTHRQNFARAIGYFGVTEYCVPFRFKFFIKGCKRLNVNTEVYLYHTLHETIDAKHAHGWFTEVIKPLVQMNYFYAKEIVIGALLRLNSSQLYLDELHSKLCESIAA